MRRIGLIGGIGPESTIEYYRLLVAGARERNGETAYPEFAMESIDMTAMLDLVASVDNDPEPLVNFLVERLGRLEHTGVEVAALASNTPHIVFDRLPDRTGIELVSIVDATVDAVTTAGCTTVGLLGTAFTMGGGFYQARAERDGVVVRTPSAPDRDYVHDRYMNELVRNIIDPATKRRLVEIVEHIAAEGDLDGLILGGTELPLILGADDFPSLQVFDTTRIHVEAVLDAARA